MMAEPQDIQAVAAVLVVWAAELQQAQLETVATAVLVLPLL
jgi:hypothetical protein